MGSATVFNPWRINDNQIQHQNTMLPKVVELMKNALVPSDISFISPSYVGDISLLQALIVINALPGSGPKTSYYDERLHIPRFNENVARLAVNKLGCIVPIFERDYKALSKKGTTLVAIQIKVTDKAVVLSQGDIKRFPDDENVFVTIPDTIRSGITSTLISELNLMRVSLDWIAITLTYLQSSLELPMDGIWIFTDKTLRTRTDNSKRLDLDRAPDVPWKEIFPNAIDDEDDDNEAKETTGTDKNVTDDKTDKSEVDDASRRDDKKIDNLTDRGVGKKQFLDDLFSGSHIKSSVISSALALATAVLSDIDPGQDEDTDSSDRDEGMDQRKMPTSSPLVTDKEKPTIRTGRTSSVDDDMRTRDSKLDSDYGELRTGADFDLFFFS